MPDLPSGTVTFLFTDIEGSTALWERDRAAMQAAVERHLTLLQTTIEAYGGVLFKIVGDSVQAAFRTAPQALAAALAAQRALLAEDWGEIGELRVRTALHAGEAEPDQRGDYLAAPLNRLSRLLSAGHGGQILLTQTVQQLSRSALPPDAELRDLGAHHLRDLLEPERIFQFLHPELQDAFPAPRTLETRPHNLPIQLTPLLGRDEEVAAVHDIVTKQGARLVTLTGPGGTGKTRLALAVAAELLGDFPDGAWFVDLAPLNDPGLVLPTIARTLGLREGNNLSLNDVVSVYLATKRLLVVLDNYEHLLTAAPVVNDLLRAGPDTVVLVTSREPLHVRGEREVAVGPLALPDHHHHAPVDIVQNPAVALFVERAQAARRDFELTDENASLVAAICRQLDGLPLAIELAAARVKVLPPGALLASLKSRLPLLAGGPRDAPARQRALRDTIAWSYDLLRAEEQALFGRLAVFVGGFTLEAAEVMAAGAPDLGIDSFEGVASLMDKSLLRSVDGLSGEPRYTMLETVREYGLERLEASGEGGEIRRRHAAYFLSMTESAHPQQLETGEAGWSERLAAERDNLRAALRWTAEHGVEGVGPEGISEPERIIAVYQRAGQMARRLYANTDALVLFRRALSLLEATPVVAPTGDSLAADLREGMADVLELTGQRDAAVTAYREASIALGNGDPVWRARLHRKLGETLQAQRRHDEAAAVFAQAEEILGLEATAPSAAWSQEWLQVQLGRMWLYYFQSDTAALARLVERVAPAVTRHGTAAQRASFFHCQTLLSFRQDHYTGSEKTMAHAQAAVAASEESGDESQLAVSRFLVGFALWQRRSPEAETHLADALVLAERIGDLTQQARCLAYLTAVIRQRGDEEGARALNDRFLAVAQVGQIKEYVAIAKANRAWLAWRKENSPLVEAEARAALALWDEVPIAFPFRWLALWPLLGALLAEQRLAEGLEVARTLLAPDLQPLPDPLAAALKAAIRAADHGNEVAGEHLREATALAESMAYL